MPYRKILILPAVFIGVCTAAACILLLSGCRSDAIVTRPGTTPGDLKRVLILPFIDLAGICGENAFIRCPLCREYFEAGPVLDGSQQLLTAQLVSLLGKQADFELVLSNHQNRPIPDCENYRYEQARERRYLVAAGTSAETDAVLTGYIYRFRQRAGTDLAVESPASVAFSIHLIRVSDGGDLWYAFMNETQSALSQDLYRLDSFIERKGRWISAEEMAVAGLSKMLRGFAGQ